MTIKSKREYLNNITSYLLELGTLADKTVNRVDLSSVEEVNDVRTMASNLDGLLATKFNINFSEKDGVNFNNYIQSLYEANGKQVYLWTSKTNVCGLYRVDSIKDVNFSFPFDINDEGVVVFLSADMKDKLLLDFYIDSTANKVVEVEVQGLNWPNIKY